MNELRGVAYAFTRPPDTADLSGWVTSCSRSENTELGFATLQPHVGRIITGLMVRASAASFAPTLMSSNA